ncbi:molybdopterin biosynthesis protein [Dethiosulfatarculus sandiegensis]|uniref:Molybdopterin molybdenumtransferase n=1 Tax=Dethiosulfatarculus sandiegensis TaxID=1429043 RepID=A0A0D2G9F0_9BACT|nr:molybdopterin biosynthesis protein [Dethiosulfatarculus sandiegensis]KIX11477.1 molybdopterin biosynthesis protein MoeA [Dethiosulfatarculus sandiegensis]
MHKRNIYLKKRPLEEARELFSSAFDWGKMLAVRTVDTVDALGMITAEEVFAHYSSPGYHAAAMDGVAVKASDTYGADDENPLLLKEGEKVFFVNTGQPLPGGADAVVMIEDLHQPGSGLVEFRQAAFPWQHVRRVGEDIVAGELLFPSRHKLKAEDLAALLQAGVFHLKVLEKPKVAIIPTGHELLDWQEAEKKAPGPGVIIESNSVLLAGLVREAGAEPLVMERQPDDPEVISRAVEQAVESSAHMVLLNAGASAGSKDFSVHVIGGLGEVLVHGVAVMPGKPSILGKVKNKPVIGTPGYAVSAWVCFDQFVAPALAGMQGQAPPQRITVQAKPARPLPSKLGQEEFLRVHLGRVGQNMVATPLKRGAGTITSLTRADGLMRIGVHSEGLEASAFAPAEILTSERALENTLVVVGSHDITLDLLAGHMAKKDPLLRVSSSHLGSLAGLMAAKEGRSHLGGTHLLDTETGDYNVSYIKRYLPDLPVKLVTLAYRQQGMIVKKGNPKGIQSLSDLERADVRLVNRQAGSGTRVLLDYALAQEGMDADNIRGYSQEEYTHMAVAVQVLSGGADVGVGILAAAKALDLDFIPLVQERYDLLIPKEHLEDHRVQVLLDTLENPDFKKAVMKLGGYDVAPMGRTAWES